MAISSPYTYGQTQTPDDEQDQTLTKTSPTASQGLGSTSSEPYSPPKSETQTSPPSPQPLSSSSDQAQAPQTFAQMQQQGLPRPPIPQDSYQLAAPGPQNSLIPSSPNQNIQQLPQQTLGNPNPQQTETVSTLPGVGVTAQTQGGGSPVPQIGMTTAQYDASTPLAGMTEQQKAQYWAAQGVTGLAYGATPTGVGANGVNTYNPGQVSSNDAALASAGQSLIPGVQAQQAQTLADVNRTTQGQNTANTLTAWQQYANSAPGKATGLDPNTVPAWFTGNATAPGLGGAFGSPVNPSNNFLPTNNPQTGTVGTQTLGGQTTNGFTPTNNPTSGGGTPSTAGQTLGGTTSTTNPSSGSTFNLLNSLTNGAAGQGAGSQLQGATQTAALNFLNNPNPYAQQDVKDQYNWLSGNIDDQYNLQRKQLGEDMAKRGLGASTIYGGNLNDLNIGQRTAQESLGTDLAHQFATSQSAAQQAALGLGNQIGTQAQNSQQNWLSQLMGYGQNAFNNDLATNQQNQNAAQSYQNYILQMLGLGYSPTG